MDVYRSTAGWADEEEETFLPPTQITGPDEKGIKTITEYKIEKNQRVKITKKIRIVEKEKRISKKINERKQWEKFGQCKGMAKGPEENITYVSQDAVLIDNPEDDGKNSRAEEENIMKKLREGMRKREFTKKMTDQGLIPEEPAPVTGGLRTGTPISESMNAGETAAGATGKYVPVHLRAGAEKTRFSDRDGEQNTLRVTNISEDTTERDLQELFRPFGSLARVYLAKDRDTQMSRGFAYVSYIKREDAEKAMKKLNGFGYDHLILKVEWAKPSSKDDVATQNVLQRGIVSGYGKALPQNVKK